MTKARFGVALMAATAVALAGCASGAGGTAEASAQEGNPPRDNTHTRSAQLFLTQAGASADTARYREALGAAQNSIAEEPMNPMGYFQAGQAQVGLGLYEDAGASFDQALELYPSYQEDVHIQRESAWIQLFNDAIQPINAGDHQQGIDLLSAAEGIYPNQRPEALINLGVSHANMNQIEEAIDSYAKALDVIRGPKTEEADSATAASWRESESSVAFNLAQLLSSAERFDEAVAEYEAFLERNPGDVGALSSLASAKAAAGDAMGAEAIYDDLLSQPNLGMRDYFNIGVGLYTAGVFDRAAEAFQNVVAVSPQSRDAVFNLAQAMFEGEAWADLVPVGRSLMEIDGHNGNTYTILAKALIETQQEQEAVEVLEAREALPFNLEGSRLAPDGAGGGSVTAEFINNSLDAGTSVTVRVHFSGDDGAEIGTTEVMVSAPAPGASETFRADLQSTESVMGYFLEVVGSS